LPEQFNFEDRFSLGISFLYQTLKIARYGSGDGYNILFGGTIKLSKSYFIGFSLHNPLRSSNSNIPFPLQYHSGLTYRSFEGLEISLSLFKEINYPFSFRGGISYKLAEFISIQFGAMNKPTIYSGGISITKGIFEINYSAANHNILGLGHQGDLIIHF
jgi:hypothetical protein